MGNCLSKTVNTTKILKLFKQLMVNDQVITTIKKKRSLDRL